MDAYYGQHNYVGEHAGTAAALAFIQLNDWDSTHDGLGTAQKGQWFYDTTSDSVRVWTGAAWVEPLLADGTVNATGILSYDAPGKPFANPAEIVDKQYVDALVAGLTMKDAVRVATQAPVVLANMFDGATIDGVVLAAGDRFLVKDQPGMGANENGVYVAQGIGVPPVRSADCAAGLKASGVWVIAEEGAGTNADKGWLCTTNGAVFGDAISYVVFPSFSGHYFGEEGVYVDATYGVDTVLADGTPDAPYRTLQYACTRVEAITLTAAVFCTPVIFRLAPGVYAGAVTMPRRLHLKVVGDNCVISGNVNWQIDPVLWTTYAVPLTNVPTLHFARNEVCLPLEANTSLALFPQGFRLAAGTLEAYNCNPAMGSQMPTYKMLMLTGAYRDTFHIYNRPTTGLATSVDAVGTMMLAMGDARASTAAPSYITGEVDRDVGAGTLVENDVRIFAERSDVYMRGVCRIGQLTECSYTADYTADHLGNPYDYGLICSYYSSAGGEVVRNSFMVADGYFGLNSAAVVPAHNPATAWAIVFDRFSLMRMAAVCATLATSFAGFSTTSNVGAYGRGWYYGFDEAANYTRLTIPCASKSNSWALFAHTYSIAANWRPGGAVLSTNNRLTIELDSGGFTLPAATFSFDKEFVNVIGKGSGAMQGNAIVAEPNTVLSATNKIEWAVTEGHLGKLTIDRSSAVEAAALVMAVGHATLSTFQDLAFRGSGAGPVWAVMLDPLVHTPGAPLLGTWEDCHTELPGFLYGGSFGGTVRRCTGGDYSFVGWHGAAALDMSFLGTAIDCDGGDYSFGATDAGGVMICGGALDRCTCTSCGYGHSEGGIAFYAATCSAAMTDCTSGVESFGYSASSTATASGTFDHCTATSSSFGSSDAAPVGDGVFSGMATNCQATSNSFGSNAADPENAVFSGRAIDCMATYQCFGARGSFTGQAFRCMSTYGSFGWQTAPAVAAVMDGCFVTSVRDTMLVDGPPGIYGGVVRRCYIATKAGEDTPCLVLMGGTAVGGDESRVYDCDLIVKDTHATTIDCTGGGFFDAQIAHCRMRVGISAGVTNVLAVPYNLVDAAYDPS